MLHGEVVKIIDFGVADYLPKDGQGLRVRQPDILTWQAPRFIALAGQDRY